MEEKRAAEFVGVMLGDGSIGIYDYNFKNRAKKHHRIKVTLDSRNKEYIKHVAELMEETLGAKPTIQFKKNENAADIGIYSKEKVIYALETIGLKISPKWGRMEIPKKYSVGNLALFVLRGLFDTDGSITIFNNNGTVYPRIEIKMCPCPAQKQIMKILDESGFRYRVQHLDRGKIRIRISGKKELKKWINLIGCSNELYLKRAKQFF